MFGRERERINSYINENVVGKLKMGCKLLVVIMFGIFLAGSVCAISDVAVFQGQYYLNDEFQQGTFTFEFDIYDDEIAGNLVDSKVFNITTGTWGQWRIEYDDLSEICNDTTKDYFMEISIDNSTQAPRKRLTHFLYLRKDIDETTIGDLTISNVLNFLLEGSLQELATSFIFSKSLEVVGDLDVNGDATIVGEVNITGETVIQGQLVCLEDGTNCDGGESSNYWNVSGGDLFTTDSYNLGLGTQAPTHELNVVGDANITGEIYSSGQLVCLEDGTNCLEDGGAVNYVSFISTVDGDLSINDRYLPLGTDSLIALTEEESAWIIDRNMTITGILWNSVSNTRSTTSAITLRKSTINKASFLETDLSKDIQGQVSGIDDTFEVNFAQGDLAVIAYESGGVGGTIHDLSVTLIGTYD